MDSGFDATFDNIEWSADNVLRFVAVPQDGPAPSSRLDIQNLSSRRIGCLRIGVSDLFLVFDLEPGGSVSLDTTTGPGNATVNVDAAELSSSGSVTIQTNRDVWWNRPNDGIRYRVLIRDAGFDPHAEQ